MNASLKNSSLLTVIARSAVSEGNTDTYATTECAVFGFEIEDEFFMSMVYRKANTNNAFSVLIKNASDISVFSGSTEDPLNARHDGGKWLSFFSEEQAQLDAKVAEFISRPIYMKGVRYRDTYIAKRVLRSVFINAELAVITAELNLQIDELKKSEADEEYANLNAQLMQPLQSSTPLEVMDLADAQHNEMPVQLASMTDVLPSNQPKKAGVANFIRQPWQWLFQRTTGGQGSTAAKGEAK